ncbi:MAG: FAD binding domain-containing protein [Desulfomonilaceae bacterium]
MIKDFKYFRPGSAREAFDLLAEHKEDCKIICGGQSLLILLRQGLVAPDNLIDIKWLNELNYIKFDAKEGLKIGATTTHRTIEKSDQIKEKYRAITEMESHLAHIQVRNWGTIGGNLAHADPAGDPAPVLMALSASIKVGSAKGERTISLDDFYTDLFETAMEEGEMVLEVQVPTPSAKTGAAYKKFNLLESDQGIVSVAACVTLNGNSTCKEARICLGNAAPTVIRAKGAEAKLVGQKLGNDLLEQVGLAAAEESDPVADIHASEDFRRHLVSVLTTRMVKEAWERAAKKA